MLRLTPLAAAAAFAGAAAFAQDATATLHDLAGKEVGTATFSATASGQTLVEVEVTGIPEGLHGLHVHESGDCSASDFESAGEHLAGGGDHGVMAEGGPHAGDMPNAHVQSDGVLSVEVFKTNLPLDDLVFDADGSAVIIHSGADDYESQPSGEAGDRIACGVIERN
jgi:Cu-Zn family superoxide dismutase